MSSDSNQSAFVVGDIVLQNPKETAVIFSIVVILSVLFENLYSYFRSNKSKYMRMLFTQVSEEILIIGTIGLLFVLIVQSISSLPARWVLLFRWTHTVLFFMMTFFVVGIILTATITRLLINKIKRLEAKMMDRDNESIDEEQLHMNSMERGFLFFRKIFIRHLRTLEETSTSPRDESDTGKDQSSKQTRDRTKDPYSLQSIPFSKYIEVRSRETVVKFTDVTWQCWLSLVLVAGINSVRLFMLPGDLQSKESSEFTSSDRLRNNISFVLVVGWLPFAIFVTGVVFLVRNYRRYSTSLESQAIEMRDLAAPGSNSSGQNDPSVVVPATRARINTTIVWLPPKQLTQQLLGEVYEDPSTYLLRGNRGFTLHMQKIPAICLEFYFSLFVVGMWGEMSANVDVAQGYLIPIALIPMIGLFVCLPISLLIVTLLTSLGSRLDPRVLRKLYMRKNKKLLSLSGQSVAHGTGDVFGDDDDDDDDEEYENWFKTRMQGDQTPKRKKKDRSTSLMSNDDDDDETNLRRLDSKTLSGSQHQHVLNALKSRIRFLEDLCQSYGIPLSGRTVDDNGEFDEQSAVASVCVALSRLEEQTTQLREQQTQLVAMQRITAQQLQQHTISAQSTGSGARSAVLQPGAAGAGGSVSSLHHMQAIGAAKKFQQQKPGFVVNNVAQRNISSHVVSDVNAHLGIALNENVPSSSQSGGAQGGVMLDLKHRGSLAQPEL